MPWSRIPWRLLVDHAPTIVDAARRLYVGSRTPHDVSPPRPGTTASAESLQRAVEQLQARDAEHAELLAELARQVQDITQALTVLRARLRWAWVGVAVAVMVALATVLFAGR